MIYGPGGNSKEVEWPAKAIEKMHAAEVVNTEPEVMEDLFVTDGRSKDDLGE